MFTRNFTRSAVICLVFGVGCSQARQCDRPAPASSPYAISRAFAEAERYTGRSKWVSENSLQQELIEDFLGRVDEVKQLPGSILDAIASTDVRAVNQFLIDRGMTSQLRPFKQGSVGAAAVFNIQRNWRAVKTEINLPGEPRGFPAVRLSKVKFFDAPNGSEPVILIFKDDLISVWVTSWDGSDSGFKAVKAAKQLTPRDDLTNQSFNGLVLPMVDLVRSNELDWLIGMKNGPFEVVQAIAQSVVQINEFGFSVRNGSAFEAAPSGAAPKVYVMKSDFLLWVTTDGAAYPVFAIKVTKGDWQRPMFDD